MQRFKNWKEPLFDSNGWAYNGDRKYGWVCQYSEGLKLGKYVDIGFGTYINSHYGVTIEDNVQIGSHCSIYSDNTENNTHGPVVIEEGTLIGSFSLILPNTIIKKNSKIRAYTVIK